jgi:PIN domain nuclease of toxin-antitoxin system
MKHSEIKEDHSITQEMQRTKILFWLIYSDVQMDPAERRDMENGSSQVFVPCGSTVSFYAVQMKVRSRKQRIIIRMEVQGNCVSQ